MKKIISFIMAFTLLAVSGNTVCYASENYDGTIQIENIQTVHSTEQITIPVNIVENTGIAGIMAKFDADAGVSLSDISTDESLLKEEIGAFDYINIASSALIWSTKSTENTEQTGNFVNLLIYAAYPGVYDISFASVEDRTMATNSSIQALDINWVNGSVTVNGNAEDIANAELIGDVNGDNEVTSYDALLILQATTQLYDMNISEQIISDSNFDGEISSYDALNLLQYSTGIISDFSDGNSSAVSVGINLDSNLTTVLNRSYYKDTKGSSVKINYNEF